MVRSYSPGLSPAVSYAINDHHKIATMTRSIMLPLAWWTLCVLVQTTHGLTSESVSSLLQKHASDIQSLKASALTKVGASAGKAPYTNDVFYLRYCLQSDDPTVREQQLGKCLDWRMGVGKSICEAAREAVEQATADNGWNNEPVLVAAPHSASITKFLTPSNVLTTTTSTKDLIYCIRAGQIDDNKLMATVSIAQMVDFFLYAKEVNALVANDRSVEQDRLVTVLTANDLSGVKLLGGSADFRKALSESSATANELYPATSGPTLLLNLPPLLGALVKLFTPLFPKAVNDRLKFANGPTFQSVASLTQVAPGGAQREAFLREVDAILG